MTTDLQTRLSAATEEITLQGRQLAEAVALLESIPKQIAALVAERDAALAENERLRAVVEAAITLRDYLDRPLERGNVLITPQRWLDFCAALGTLKEPGHE